jgi:hypothetical protein
MNICIPKRRNAARPPAQGRRRRIGGPEPGPPGKAIPLRAAAALRDGPGGRVSSPLGGWGHYPRGLEARERSNARAWNQGDDLAPLVLAPRS